MAKPDLVWLHRASCSWCLTSFLHVENFFSTCSILGG